jgi:nucleotide-binding universal stress UspA family protein
MDQAEHQPGPGQPERHRPPRTPWPQRRRPVQPDQLPPDQPPPDQLPPAPHQPGPTPPGPTQQEPALPPGRPQPIPAQPGPAQSEPAQSEPAQPESHPGWPEDCAGRLAAAQPLTEADHPVVVGYDGSAPSRNALAYAAGMAQRLGRTLLVAYITSPAVFCEPLTGQVIAPPRDTRETHRWLLAELDEVCDRTGLDVCIVTRQGSPARELAAAADEFHADALVIGAPGRMWHQLAGSVPGWLARHAHCPVIVVP